jgi:hypothetical protein
LNPVIVTLTATCPPTQGDSTTQSLRFDGGCVTYQTSIPDDAAAIPSFDIGGGLTFVDRVDVVTFVDQEEGLILCGADAAPCES